MKVDENMKTSPVLVFDIETRQTTDADVIEQITIAAADKQPAQSASKATKESWFDPHSVALRVNDALHKTALDPFLAEVVCVSWSQVIGGELIIDTYDCQEGERYLLECVRDEWLFGRVNHDPIWTGHNIKHFDLPVLLNRMRRHRITPPDTFPRWTGRYWRGSIHDTMEHCPGPKYISCVNACERYGIERTPIYWRADANMPLLEIDGSMVQALVDAGEWSLIADYCANDVRDEFALYCVQTVNELRPSYDVAGGGLDAVLRDIDAAEDLTNGAKWITARAALKSAGVLK